MRNFIANWLFLVHGALSNHPLRLGAMRPGSQMKTPGSVISPQFTATDERVVRNPHRPKQIVSGRAETIINATADALKAQVRTSGLEDLRCIAVELMKKMRLLDENESFLVPGMEAFGESILPGKFNIAEIYALIDRMTMAMIENEFAVLLFEKASQKDDWSGLIKRIDEFGSEELPNFIAYSIILQNLTVAMFNDVKLLSATLTYWLKIVDDENLTKHMSIPFRVKYESIMYPAKKYNEYVSKGECPEDFAKFLLPLNIMEAVLFDVLRGNFDNSFAGFELTKHGTGGAPNPKTGAGYTRVTNGTIATGQDLVESWNDLYQVWNAFFVSTFGTTYLVKLLIPQVSGYHGGDKPGAYAYNRVIALIVNLFMTTFDHFDVSGDLTGKTDSVFVNKILLDQKELFKVWGEANNECAALYAQDVKHANRSDHLNCMD